MTAARATRRKAAWAPVAVAALALAGPAAAHELEANRLALVLRDSKHLSLTFQIDGPEALHRVLAPNQPLRQFAITHAALPPAQFEAALRRAQGEMARHTTLTLPDGRALPIGRWQWPAPARWQAALQQVAMQALVAPGEHAHDTGLQVQAEAVAPVAVDRVTVQPAPALQPLLLVWYRPQQTWLNPRSPKAEARF